MGRDKLLMCKGQCHLKYNTKKVIRGEKNGFKRCTICALYIKWEGLYCPCCGVKLKSSPTNNLARQRYREKNEMLDM